jgi:O-antigen ligase
MSGYVWILPAVIAVGWILSWWSRPWMRWTLLPAGAVVSVLVVVMGFNLPVPPLPPDSGCTREQVQCWDSRPVFWLETGLLGFVCCAVLVVPTLVAEIVVRMGKRGAADAPG